MVLGNLAHTIIQLDYSLRRPTAFPEVTYFNSATQEAGRVDLMDIRLVINNGLSLFKVFWEIKPSNDLAGALNDAQRRLQCNLPGDPCGARVSGITPGWDYGAWVIQVPGLADLLAWQEQPGVILDEWQSLSPYPRSIPFPLPIPAQVPVPVVG